MLVTFGHFPFLHPFTGFGQAADSDQKPLSVGCLPGGLQRLLGDELEVRYSKHYPLSRLLQPDKNTLPVWTLAWLMITVLRNLQLAYCVDWAFLAGLQMHCGALGRDRNDGYALSTAFFLIPLPYDRASLREIPLAWRPWCLS